MFRRLTLESWHQVAVLIAFGVSLCVFLAVVIRILRMKRERVEHAAHLPLEDTPSARHESKPGA